MPKSNKQPYQAYMLRCWQEQDATADETAIWRFTLQAVAGEKVCWGFSSMEALVAFLEAKLSESAEPQQHSYVEK